MNVSLPPFVQDPEKGATLDLTIEDMDDEPIVIEEFMHAWSLVGMHMYGNTCNYLSGSVRSTCAQGVEKR